MGIYDHEAAFGAADKTSRKMRRAIGEWFALYYQQSPEKGRQTSQRIAYTLVNKLTKTVFGEYTATAADPVTQALLDSLGRQSREAMQLALMGGECYLKPCPAGEGFTFSLIPRNNALIFARDSLGRVTDIGTLERCQDGRFYYTLLERRRLDGEGCLILENRLYRSHTGQTLGTPVALSALPQYRDLRPRCRFPQPLGGIGLVQIRTPMVNCVDGSRDAVAVYAPAVELIRSIDRNEALLTGEFERGQSRLLVSADMLREGQLTDELFVALDESPETVGMTIFAPALREQSFLARKQEYLRNVESIIGLKRGLLSDANLDERTATEIAASNAEYNLTVMDFQAMWQQAVMDTVALCRALAQVYAMPLPQDRGVTIDWGNGVLYDEEKTWADYQKMVADGLLKPEIALAWRFGLPWESEAALAAIREKYMPGPAVDPR